MLYYRVIRYFSKRRNIRCWIKQTGQMCIETTRYMYVSRKKNTFGGIWKKDSTKYTSRVLSDCEWPSKTTQNHWLETSYKPPSPLPCKNKICWASLCAFGGACFLALILVFLYSRIGGTYNPESIPFFVLVSNKHPVER